MPPSAHRERSLLEELDLRQDEVLEQLEDLEHRVESLINEYLQARGGAPDEL